MALHLSLQISDEWSASLLASRTLEGLHQKFAFDNLNRLIDLYGPDHESEHFNRFFEDVENRQYGVATERFKNLPEIAPHYDFYHLQLDTETPGPEVWVGVYLEENQPIEQVHVVIGTDEDQVRRELLNHFMQQHTGFSDVWPIYPTLQKMHEEGRFQDMHRLLNTHITEGLLRVEHLTLEEEL
ncbi:hypothetical protein [Deinococcus roseus]|uniref:Uncharacterized protein n=1 Tax=Deinococcus roseus TaxID=392414 RepID=A0ABQ2D3A3_9DEIO|nr:hypothetical protein [Deinococcus roseus]GGJ44287.1 hypothetical protein GCM10008938_33160 [Deinococcus roseus]